MANRWIVKHHWCRQDGNGNYDSDPSEETVRFSECEGVASKCIGVQLFNIPHLKTSISIKNQTNNHKMKFYYYTESGLFIITSKLRELFHTILNGLYTLVMIR